MPDVRPGGQAARVGAEFGLGAVQAAGTARRHTRQWRAGALMMTAGLSWGLLLIWWIPVPALALAGVLAVPGLVLAVLSPAVYRDRLFLYAGGAAELVAGAAEPRVLRWADLESVTLWFDSEGGTLERCQVKDRHGLTMAAQNRRGTGLKELAGCAARALESRVLPDLTAALDAGEPVRFGSLVITCRGVEDDQRGRPWAVPLGKIRDVKADGPGRSLRIRTRGGRSRDISLSGRANAVLAHRVLAHALGGTAAGFRTRSRY